MTTTFFLEDGREREEGAFGSFSPFQKKRSKKARKERKNTRDQERKSSRFDKKKKLNARSFSFSLLFHASTWQSRSRVRASSALSRRAIPRLSMVRVR